MGGGAIRAAAKVAGITAAGGIRSMTSEHYSAARKAASAIPVAAKAEEMKLMAKNSEAGLQRPCLEMDEWVFPDAEEAAADLMPRVVFGGLPSLQEAKEATSELSAALEKTYLTTPNSVGNAGSVAADHNSNKLVVDTKSCIMTQTAATPSIPAPAVMAFKFLHESSNAKNVVASIACDPNVWNAVLQNDELQQFLQSQMACDSRKDMNSSMESFADYDIADKDYTTGLVTDYDPKGFTGSSKLAEYEVVSGFTDAFQKMKSSVVDMVSSLSGYMQNLFGVKGGSGVLVNSDGTARVSADAVMQASFMGLAVMAILVILMKRAN
ncbi:hypothetical protein C2S51_036639 [Perilla frutescens var. frutescens]|nr:hypothetical protein C2S51_036639 [Perilla frutescens var. frutescens]